MRNKKDVRDFPHIFFVLNQLILTSINLSFFPKVHALTK